jgi:DNA-binding CsgD family transcriptional regulator/5-methylcytosine-specific restriction endonuclease McrA
MTKEQLERYLAEGLSLEQIGKRVGRNPSTISYHLKKHGLKPVNQGKHANKGPLPRDALASMAAEGLSLARMAEQLGRSAATVRYWINRYEIPTAGRGLRRPELRAAKQNGQKRVKSRCPRHGMAMFVLENRGYYRCMQCRIERVSERRRRAKRRLMRMAGGACTLCGYDRYPGALQFHHLDPAEKRFSISREGVTRSFAELRAEAEKCVLLCANCHAEVEGGYSTLPARPLDIAA